MNILDKIYLNLYWSAYKGGRDLYIDSVIDKIFMILLYGLYILILSIIFFIIRINIGLVWLVLISVFLAFVTSERISNIYLTVERKKQILSTYPKPKGVKYLILILVILFSLAIMIIGTILAGIIYHWLFLNLNITAANSVYNQLLGWWFANQNLNTKQKHSSLNAQGRRNWIRQRFVSATGHTRGRCEQWGLLIDNEVITRINVGYQKGIPGNSKTSNRIIWRFCPGQLK